MQIDGVEYTLFKDYDRHPDKFGTLTFDGKITYLDERVKLILIQPCGTAIGAGLKDNLALILVTAICAGISAAGTYLAGRKALPGWDRAYFVAFVKNYMDPILQTAGPANKPWADWMYGDLRCGLAHNFTVTSGGIEYANNLYVNMQPHGPEICPQHLLDDFSNAWTKYLADVKKDGKGKGLGQKFEKRFDEVFLQ